MSNDDDKELNRERPNTHRVEANASFNRTISPAQQAIENRKRHRNNDTTPPPELGQNLNA